MKAVVITASGGPEVLRLEDRPDPEPGPRQVRVRVRASALNRADLLQRRGRYPAPAGFPPDIPGLEFAGEVESCGAECSRWRVGDRVMGIIGGGGHAEYVCIPQDEILPVPASLSWAEAGATPEVFLTAYDALFRQAELVTGERLLIHAVASGVGTAALQLAHAFGASVCGTSRSPEKLQMAGQLGLEGAIDSSGDWLEEVSLWSDGDGVDVVLDLVGGPWFAQSLQALAPRGRIVAVGTMAGARTEIDLGLLLRKRAHLIGTVLRSRTSAEKAELTREFERHALPLLASGKVRPIIDEVFAFEHISEAHERMERNESFGKLALLWR